MAEESGGLRVLWVRSHSRNFLLSNMERQQVVGTEVNDE